MNEIKRPTQKDVMESIDQINKDMQSDFSHALHDLELIPPEFCAERMCIKAQIQILQKYSKRMYELYMKVSKMAVK